MLHLSDIAAQNAAWWSRPRNWVVTLMLLAISSAVMLFVLFSARAASESDSSLLTKTLPSSQKASTLVRVVTNASDNNPTKPTDPESKNTSTASPSSNTETNDNTVEVTVNGQTVPVPEQGSVHRTMQSADGQTTVDISASQNGETSNSSYSSLQVNVSSNSSSSSTNSSVTIGGTTESN